MPSCRHRRLDPYGNLACCPYRSWRAGLHGAQVLQGRDGPWKGELRLRIMPLRRRDGAHILHWRETQGVDASLLLTAAVGGRPSGCGRLGMPMQTGDAFGRPFSYRGYEGYQTVSRGRAAQPRHGAAAASRNRRRTAPEPRARAGINREHAAHGRRDARAGGYGRGSEHPL